MERTQEHRFIGVATPLGKDVLLLDSFSYSEALGSLFEMKLDLLSERTDIEFAQIVGQNITVRLDLPGDKKRYFNGYVNRFSLVGQEGGSLRYSATVVPWLWFLARTSDCRLFQNETVPDIIKKVFKTHASASFDEALSGEYRTWEYCVQYRETDFNFVSRLMEQEGIYYFFKHEDGKHSLVLADSPSAHKPYAGYEKIPYYPPTQQTREGDYISDWDIEQNIQPRVFTHTDFNFKEPGNDLTASRKLDQKRGGPDFEIFDYPGEYTSLEEGEKYARTRIEEIQAGFETLRGETTARGISAGFTFDLTNHPRQDQQRSHLITSVSLSASTPGFHSGETGEQGFSCSFTAVDAKQPYRVPRATPKPSIPGPQTAMVVGPSGEEIFTDEYGRVKVQFHWDRYGKADENSSCWIRVAQLWAGKKWGAMYIPRIGQEVIVEFLEGDPDQPIITGRVYNAQSMPPYDPKANKTVSTIKSNSSKGGQGFNEIRFDDKKGKEQIFIHAEKNQDIRVKNDCLEFEGRDRHLIVKRDQFEQVDGDKHLTVKGDQNEKINGTVSVEAGMDMQQKVGMNHALEAGMEVHIKGGMKVIIEAGMQLSIKAGSSFVDLGPAGVSISGPMIMLNSGGAAGAGSGCSPDAAKLPKEAATADPGEVSEPPRAPRPPEPVTHGSQATVMKQAADDGTPFCEQCEAAKKDQNG
ncbi:MAG: type VI secretion system tip protein VgrG [Sedimentisphaerales bacterium]|nr:type VI secretion system tip protein VgrG [Sedimentisphaerales bacterium]